jgi:hypothetical protein
MKVVHGFAAVLLGVSATPALVAGIALPEPSATPEFVMFLTIIAGISLFLWRRNRKSV